MSHHQRWKYRVRRLLLLTGLTVVYTIAGKLGLRFAFVHANATAVWPPTGIALAALLIFGYRVWPSLFAGAFIVNSTTAGSLGTSLGIALGNTLEGLIGAFLVNLFANGAKAFERPQDIFKFAIFAGMVSTAVSATFGVTSLMLGGFASWGHYGAIWLTWWLGDMGGALLITPGVILWRANRRVPWKPLQIAEVVFLLCTVGVMGKMVFGGFAPTNAPLEFLCIPPLIWLAFRFGPRETVTALLLLAVIATQETLHKFGPFGGMPPNESLLSLQAYMIVMSVMTMTLAAAFSQRKRAAEQFQLAVESSPSAMVMVNHRGKIVLVNSQTEQLFGYDRTELMGRTIEVLVPERFRGGHHQFRVGFFAHPETRTMGVGRDLYGRHKDGREFPVEIGLNPIQTDGGLVVLSAIIDITARKRAEAALERAREELEEKVKERTKSLAQSNEELKTEIAERERVEQALRRAHAELEQSHELLKSTHLQLIQAAKMESVGQLAAGVAHEVKNPLAVILQGLDYFAKRVIHNDGEAAEVLRYTVEAVKRADAVVRGLLDFSATKELVLRHEPLNEVVEQAMHFVKHEVDRQRVQVAMQLATSLPPVNIDRQKVEQVFINVFLNAVHAMPDGGTLTVRTFPRQLTEPSHEVGLREQDRFKLGETVVVAEVEDTGVGIPEAALSKIFDPFYTMKPKGQGTGLGLTVTKNIIELHQGTIRIGNREGGGVKVVIMLKAVD